MTAAQRERSALVDTLRARRARRADPLRGLDDPRPGRPPGRSRTCGSDATPGSRLPFLPVTPPRCRTRSRSRPAGTTWSTWSPSGPPLYSPFKLLDPVANLGEMFIHHEDVRRAVDGWQPRVLDDSIVAALRRQLGLMSRMTLSKAARAGRAADARRLSRSPASAAAMPSP